MDVINKYFGKIIFIKSDLRENHSIYVAALSSSFQDGKKQYVLAFVPQHLAIADRGYLRELQWVNLQTRTMKNGYRLTTQRWDIAKGLDNPMFTMVERTENKTKYLSDLYPLEMVLLHDPKKTSKYQYHNHINLLAAMATFKCVISILDGGSRESSAEYMREPSAEYGKESSAEYGTPYRPMGESSRYMTIDLPDYHKTPTEDRRPQQMTVDDRRPQVIPKRTEDRRPQQVTSKRPPQPMIDDSFELIQ